MDVPGKMKALVANPFCCRPDEDTWHPVRGAGRGLRWRLQSHDGFTLD